VAKGAATSGGVDTFEVGTHFLLEGVNVLQFGVAVTG